MTDDNLDSGQTLGNSGQPSQQSSNVGDKQSSGSEGSVDVVGERLTRMESMLKSLQGDKDRGVQKALGEVGELRKTFGELQQLMKKGLSEDDAFEALESRKADEEFKSAVMELRDSLKGGKSLPIQANGTKAVPSVVEQYNLDPNDPEVVASVLTQTDPKDVEIAALRLAHKRATQPPPSPSAAGTLTGSPPHLSDDNSKIERIAQLQKSPSINRTEIKRLEQELGWAKK